MLALDEHALICDFAETYHILDIYAIPVETAAILASGLRENSRIRTKIEGITCTTETYILTASLDALRTLVWQNTKDARKNKNKPKRLTESLELKKKKTQAFDSFKEFDAMRKSILES